MESDEPRVVLLRNWDMSFPVFVDVADSSFLKAGLVRNKEVVVCFGAIIHVVPVTKWKWWVVWGENGSQSSELLPRFAKI